MQVQCPIMAKGLKETGFTQAEKFTKESEVCLGLEFKLFLSVDIFA